MLEADLITSLSLLPALVIALLAGVLSFLSPCVLPIVPPYLAYMSGASLGEISGGGQRRRVLGTAAMFVLGLSTVFVLLGLGASALGRALGPWLGVLNTIAAITVMIFGAHFVGVFRIGFLDREARIQAGDHGGTGFGAYILGLAFAFGWTPCLGPVLGAILTLAATEASLVRGMLLLLAYAAGLGIPFLLVAAFLPRLGGALAWLKRHLERIERIAGLLLWTIGLMMLTGQFSAMSFWLVENLPFLSRFG